MGGWGYNVSMTMARCANGAESRPALSTLGSVRQFDSSRPTELRRKSLDWRTVFEIILPMGLEPFNSDLSQMIGRKRLLRC